MEKEYLPHKIESYVQEYWKINKTFQVIENTKKEKYYCLPMLPYPSGKLHMGHVRNYTISDVISRYQRMLGKNVLQPMGWDAFGLPAEEASIKNNTPPEDWTKKNIKYMKKQLQSLGFSYDWSREITTCKPEYYQWEQWFFIKLYENKLVYKKNSFVNWCDYDKTVLANEQVINGCCWRCQGTIKIKKIPQWFLKIRKYAESLHQDLNKLVNWPENVKNMQRNWIGRTKGFNITMNILNNDHKIKAFTNRLDLIMGVTYIAISCCNKLAISLSKKNQKIKQFIKTYEHITPAEKEKIKYLGMNTNMFAIHPITEEKIPIWITNYIVKELGTSSILCIPGHNENHWYFAKKYNLKITYVILHDSTEKDHSYTACVDKKGVLFNSQEFNGLNFQSATKKIKTILVQKNVLKDKINYRLQDWCISRQRYWGTPIPMAKLKNGKTVPIPKNELPVLLPEIQKHTHLLKKFIDPHSKWAQISINQQDAIRETDTFDTFIESSWYYARYTSPNFNKGMIDLEASKYWLPVDQYIGGIEHATMHLIYFRFYHKLLRDFKFVNIDEPVNNLLCQGMVLSDAFYTIEGNLKRNWIHSSLVIKKRDAKGKITQAYTKEGKKVVYAGMIKMSKSKNNGIEPDVMIQRYGADTIRLFIMFAAPVESSLEWKESSVEGIYRFLKKLWALIFRNINLKHTKLIAIDKMLFNEQQSELLYQLHYTIAKVSDDIDRRKNFNTAISAIMTLVNKLEKTLIQNEQDKFIMKECLLCIIKMLYPFVPHFCFISWKHITDNTNIDNEKWPIYDTNILRKKSTVVVIQINGKKRSTIQINDNLNQEEACSYAKKQKNIQKYLHNTCIKKIVYIPKKIINFVV